jgi:inosine-uridine nucleoside N-ribohydrolase
MGQDDPGLLARLRKPQGRVDVVLDTDTYNEIDDQFAISLLVKCPEKFNIKGIYAAPFFNKKSTGPADGMEKSYEEIQRVLALLKREDLLPLTRKGSTAFLPSETGGLVSPAASSLAELAASYSPEKPLYVIAIGAITNVASALLLRPEIKDRIVIVWLGGNAHHWPGNREFNLFQDVAAARIIFGCGAAVVQLPCRGVVSALTVSGPELEHWLRGKNELCDYLVKVTVDEALADRSQPVWTRVIWDVAAVAWFLDLPQDAHRNDPPVAGVENLGAPLGGAYMLDHLVPSPIPQYDDRWSFDPTRHFIRYVYHINRDALFTMLFKKLAE